MLIYSNSFLFLMQATLLEAYPSNWPCGNSYYDCPHNSHYMARSKAENINYEGKYPDNREVVSFFSGAMGLDLGLEAAGLNVVVGQDFDINCINTMQENGHEGILGDIREISPESVLNKAGLDRGEPFLVCGGPPCQPFSTAGKRMGINDPRGSLFMDYIRMIDYIRPRFFVMENVKGLLSAPLRTEDNSLADTDLTVRDVILTEFDKLGYKTTYGVLDAVNYGVPQFRERLVLIGSRDNEDIFLPIPSHFQKHQNPDNRWKTLGSAIKDLEDDDSEHMEFSEDRLDLLKMVPPGGNWRNLPVNIQEKAMGGAYASGGGKVGFYRRLSYDEPSPTLVTSPVQKSSMLCHPTRDRPLSIKEYARIQQFPDDWILTGNTAAKYRQIGNAVPVGLGKAIGLSLISTADGTAEIHTRRIRGTSIHSKISKALEVER